MAEQAHSTNVVRFPMERTRAPQHPLRWLREDEEWWMRPPRRDGRLPAIAEAEAIWVAGAQ